MPAAIAIAGLAAVLLLLAGLVSAASASTVPLALLASSALLALFAAFSAVSSVGNHKQGPANVAGSNRNLEQTLETLEDLRWQARDNSAHLQALLDGQLDIIMHRNAAGRLTFVNRAFCQTFDMSIEEVIGKPFHPKVIERVAGIDPAGEPSAMLPAWGQPVIEQIGTSDGKRWIEWTHRTLHGPETADAGIQTIGRDVTWQRRHEQALAAARDEALAADRAKSRFLASMSHEIRTPMNGILGMAGLLSETHQSPEQRTYTDAVRKSAATLLALIDEILDFSKIEAGHLELVNQPFDVVECLQNVVELLAPRADQKRLQLAWSLAPDMPRASFGDEARLRQILLNLVGNAIKFTKTGGVSIWLGAEPQDDGRDLVQVVVRDTGPGLTEEARERIFTEFERAAPHGVAHETGTGLGLAIAQRLARCMNGGIRVSSTPGEGATFTLSVSLHRAVPRQESSSREILAGRHIAIVSTELIERRTIANLLRAHNMSVTELNAVAGLSALAHDASTTRLDTVLFNSAIDPTAARRALDQLVGGGTIGSAVIAATANRSEFDRFAKAGIADFLVRPIRPSTLLALLAGEVGRADTTGAPGEHGTEQAHDPGRAATGPPMARRVLVAEDNEINALLTRTVLTRLGCTAIVAPNGQEAIDEIQRSLAGSAPPIDVVLMDLHMPLVDGFEAAAAVRRLCAAAGRPVPAILAVTANAFAEDRERCLAAGMDGYLAKPFEPGDLRRALDEVTAARLS